LRHSSQQATILVVEDGVTLRQAVVKMLRRAGFFVIEVGDGSTALEAIRAPRSSMDVLLLDITIPGAPSREVFEEAKRLRPGMRVIVTSAYNEEMAAESLGGRAERFIRKPYRIGDLTELIRQALS
jgi:DNA-binding NtrC family response regulator